MPRRKRNLKWAWGLAFLLLIVVVMVVILINNNTSKGEADDATSSGQNVTGEAQQSEQEGEKDPAEGEQKKEEVLQYDGDDPNDAEELSGVISYAGVNDGNLIIRVNIDQYLTSGECALSLSKDGANIYNMTAKIESSVATSTCVGFNVPTSGLSSGDLKVKIELKAGGKSGIIEGEVTI